jgi:hypothetical protein
MIIVTHFIAVSFIDTLVSALQRWRDSNAEMCRIYAKDSTNTIWKSEFVGIT